MKDSKMNNGWLSDLFGIKVFQLSVYPLISLICLTAASVQAASGPSGAPAPGSIAPFPFKQCPNGVISTEMGQVIVVPGPIPRDPLDMTDLCNVSNSHFATSMFCLSGMDFNGDSIQDSAPPPAPPIPASAPADSLENFWWRDLPNRVNGKGNLITCLDGTTPAAWFSKARNRDFQHPDEYLESNKWIFYFQGGGACSEGQLCADKYLACNSEKFEMTTAHLQFVGRSARHNGILSSDTSNPFAEFNRVVIHKCGFDRFNGFVVDSAASSTQMGTYDRRQMGYNIVNAFLEQLRSGWSYDGWDIQHDDWRTIDLPPLEDAELILFLGTSGGAHGLYHNIDRFSSRVRSWNGFAGQIAAIFDSNFMPSLDGEDGDMYSGNRAGTTNSIGWDDHIYQPGGAYHNIMHAWEAVGDKSCRTAHRGVDEHTCLDRHHVLANHIETDFLVLQDHWDPNPGHCKAGLAGFEPDFANGSGLTHSCGTAFDLTVPNPFGDLVDAQANAIAFSYGASLTGNTVDPHDPSPRPTRFFVGLRCNSHEHLIKPAALATEMEHPVFGNFTLETILTDWTDNFLGSRTWGVFNPLNGWSMVPGPGACP